MELVIILYNLWATKLINIVIFVLEENRFVATEKEKKTQLSWCYLFILKYFIELPKPHYNYNTLKNKIIIQFCGCQHSTLFTRIRTLNKLMSSKWAKWQPHFNLRLHFSGIRVKSQKCIDMFQLTVANNLEMIYSIHIKTG